MGEIRLEEWDIAKAASADAMALHNDDMDNVLGATGPPVFLDIYVAVHEETLLQLGWRRRKSWLVHS